MQRPPHPSGSIISSYPNAGRQAKGGAELRKILAEIDL